jgi:YVTN family beta-propeller protein
VHRVRAPGLAFSAVLCAVACDEHFPTLPSSTGAPLSAATTVIPPAARRDASSAPVAFDALRGLVWTANGDVGSVSYVDVDTRVHVEVPILRSGSCGGRADACDVRSVAVSPDGAWVAAVDRAAALVVLVNPDQPHTVQRAIPVGSHPRACVWDSANPRWLYVALEDDGAVAVVDRDLASVVDTIPVGRLPSGVAVSATRREVYVPHRIDADLTIIDLHQRAVVADVPLADEPFSTPKTPNGKPLGFESLAITSDGRRAWMPHELLAPTHPFVFDQTLFPAISVVDLAQRVEMTSDPNLLPRIDGRKNLFGAINIPGPDEQPAIFSQLCAVAMHPDGFVAWALACASEDLLAFDVNEGVAIYAIRNLAGDHPAGLALDDTGQRLFVLSDQSHTLLTIDTAAGNPVGRARVYGGDPIPLVDRDPVDPTLREGYKLFFRANSSKGPWPTTGNDWMSCGGCHLDGFGSTNARLFEALSPSDPARDAAIGHGAVTEAFGPTATHDLLAALLEQGGLAPDPTGRDRSGQVDPSSPPSGAKTMAESLALVVQRDLSVQPSWLQFDADAPPNPAWDAAYCGKCHVGEYEAWSASVHAHAAADPMVDFCVAKEPSLKGMCAGCHDPTRVRLGAGASAATATGVTCITCHDAEGVLAAGGNGDLLTVAHADWAGGQSHKARASAALDRLRQPAFCGGCHEQFVPGTGLASISTLSEYHASPYEGTASCVDCHMPKANGMADHRFPGGNVFLGQAIGDDALVQAQQRNLASAVVLEAKRVAGGVQIIVTNRGAGHAFPTGVTDIREPWVEVRQLDASGNATQIYGGPGGDGLLPADAARLGIDLASATGAILYDHTLSEAARVPFDVRVPAGGAQSLFVAVPASVPAGSLEAVLYYRNVRTQYYRDATGDATGHAPDVLVARAPVQVP